jgi:hypothetical protein
MHFDLEASFLARCHGRPVAEAQRFQLSAERNHVLRERAAKIGGMAPGVEAAKVGVQLAFRGPNAGLVANDQGSIYRGHGAPARSLSLNPAQNLVHAFQAGDVAQA